MRSPHTAPPNTCTVWEESSDDPPGICYRLNYLYHCPESLSRDALEEKLERALMISYTKHLLPPRYYEMANFCCSARGFQDMACIAGRYVFRAGIMQYSTDRSESWKEGRVPQDRSYGRGMTATGTTFNIIHVSNGCENFI
jgi:hypothetical protein